MSQLEPRTLLVLRFADSLCAIDPAEIVAIDQDGLDARVSVTGSVPDLATYLPHCKSAAPPVRLIIELDGNRRAFLARAVLELLYVSSVHFMPRIVRECGCASWLRGVVVLTSGTNEERGREQPGLWLHLGDLAHATRQDTQV